MASAFALSLAAFRPGLGTLSLSLGFPAQSLPLVALSPVAAQSLLLAAALLFALSLPGLAILSLPSDRTGRLRFVRFPGLPLGGNSFGSGLSVAASFEGEGPLRACGAAFREPLGLVAALAPPFRATRFLGIGALILALGAAAVLARSSGLVVRRRSSASVLP